MTESCIDDARRLQRVRVKQRSHPSWTRHTILLSG